MLNNYKNASHKIVHAIFSYGLNINSNNLLLQSEDIILTEISLGKDHESLYVQLFYNDMF